MILKPAPTTTAQVRWNAEVNAFIGEMSETNGLGRVYDDACDEGLTLVSTRTGREIVFVVAHVEYADGDLRWWDLVALEGDYRMTLFND